MRLSKYVYQVFNEIDHINRNGEIEQEEIDSFRGTGSVYDPDMGCYNIKAGMSVFSFAKENMDFFRDSIQYTDRIYKEGRRIKDGSNQVTTELPRKTSPDDSDSIHVKQGQFAVKTYSPKNTSLQTCDICTCVAVTVYDKATQKGFLAHIDSVRRAQNLKEILQTAGFNPETSEVRIIGGYTDCSEGTIEMIDEVMDELKLNVVEYDILGSDKRSIQMDLQTGEVSNYTEQDKTPIAEIGFKLVANEDSE